ncbi:MAG: hypothetical protein IJH00_03880 [Erysipelotrichaceae bacterium]|nr:hypothetical protein [Erysipelotrichaceae bacterium]
MIKNDFEKLNSDDWLKKEIEREKRVSAWDFDEGKRVRNEHAEDCDARNNAFEHEIRHSRRRSVEPGRIENNPGRSNPVWFALDIVLLVGLIVFHAYLGNMFYFSQPSMAIFFLSFMLFNPAVIIFCVLKKRLMPSIYYLIAFIVAIMLESFWLMINIRFLYYIF